MSLAGRLFFVVVVLVVLALAAAIATTQYIGRQIAYEEASAALSRSAESQANFSAERRLSLERSVSVIAAEPGFTDYLAAALGDDLGFAQGGAPDLRSVQDLFAERRASFDLDLMLLVDAEGFLLARSDLIDAPESRLNEDPLLAAVRDELRPQSGYWRFEDALYQAAAVPVSRDDVLLGTLLVAASVDDAMARAVANAAGAELAFWLPVGDELRLVASSLPERTAAMLSKSVHAEAGIRAAIRNATIIEDREVILEGERWLVHLEPTAAVGVAELGVSSALASESAAFAPFGRILSTLGWTGLIVLGIAIPLSWWLSRRALAPARALVLATERAAAGEYDSELDTGSSDELGRLARAIDGLLSALREKRDTESYIATFSRFVDDAPTGMPAEAMTTAVLPAPNPPRAVRGIVLAVEWPIPSPQLDSSLDPDDEARSRGRGGETTTMDSRSESAAHNPFAGIFSALSQRVAQLPLACAATGAELVEVAGQRAVLLFPEPVEDIAWLAALRAIDEELVGGGCSAAVLEGELLVGDTVTVARPAGLQATAVGAPMQAVLRLLGESRSDRLLLAPAIAERLRQRVDLGESIETVTGSISGRRYPAVGLASLAALPAYEPPLAALPTSELTAAGSVAPGVADRAFNYTSGDRFGSRFELLGCLGAGGMGIVYKARDVELGDVVALKLLRGDALATTAQRERLKDEIRLARKITHPNVLRTFDYGEVDGQPYISMEFVRGVTLRGLLEQSARLPYSAGLRIARQLVAGLDAAHAVGVIHRDIKPENLILEAGGNARLMDFGIARPLRRDPADGQTAEGMYIGTPRYSSPEQLAGGLVDVRADLHAAGALMFEMFSGQVPFPGTTLVEVYMQQIHEGPIPLQSIWAEAPDELVAIIERCLARRVEDRYPSAAELGADLAMLRA